MTCASCGLPIGQRRVFFVALPLASVVSLVAAVNMVVRGTPLSFAQYMAYVPIAVWYVWVSTYVDDVLNGFYGCRCL